MSTAPGAAPAPPANASATARQAAAQAFGRGGSATGGVGAASPVALAVATVRAQPAGVARDCLMTLTKVIDNIVAHPTEDKYRKIKRANAGFLRKVGFSCLPRGGAVGRRVPRASRCVLLRTTLREWYLVAVVDKRSTRLALLSTNTLRLSERRVSTSVIGRVPPSVPLPYPLHLPNHIH